MNNKISKILVDTGKGHFNSVNDMITKMEVNLDAATAAKIVIECCRIFVKNESTVNINENDLCELLATCIRVIENISDDVALRYVQSIFFIMNYFFKQENFHLMLRLENALLPAFVYPLKNDKLKQTYGSVCDLVHNALAKISTLEATEENNTMYILMCILSMKMHCIRFPTKMQLVDKAKTYLKSSIFCETHIELQYKSFWCLLHLIDEQSLGAYAAIIKILEIVISKLIKAKEFGKITEYFDSALVKLSNICRDKQYLPLRHILQNASQFTIELGDNEKTAEILRNNYESSSEYFRTVCGTYGLTMEIQNTAVLIYAILTSLVQYYSYITPTVWSICLPEKTQVALYKLLGVISHIAAKTKSKCQFCPNCQVKTNLQLGCNITSLVGDLLKASISKEMHISYTLALQALYYLERSCFLAAELKNQECAVWQSSWTNVGISLYNIGVKLYATKHSECNKYFSLLIQSLIKLKASAVFEFDVLNVSLSCLVEIYIDSCQFKRALMFAAIQILLSPGSKSSCKLWMRIKSKERQSNAENYCLQHLTIVCVLEDTKAEIVKFCPELNINLDVETKIQLLLTELAQYKSMWPSSVVMVAAFKKLYETADTFTTAKILVEIWGDMNYVPNDLFEIVSKLFSKLKGEGRELDKTNENLEKLLCIAALYFIKYYTKTVKIRQAVVDRINNTEICLETALAPHEMPKNPNDECDLVPSYVNLRVDECMGRIQFLNEALSLFNTCIPNSTSPYIVELLQKYNIFGIVAKIADEFDLHCDSLHASQAWFVCLKIAKLLENDVHMLKSISCLTENANMNSEIVNQLLQEGEHLVNKLHATDSTDMCKTIISFHISKSAMLLHNQKIEAGYDEYKKALNIFNSITEESDHQILKAQLDFLHIQYLQLPCNFGIEDHNKNSLDRCSRVLNQITSFVKSQGNTSSLEKTTLFKINQAVVHKYTWMSFPREVRCYGRDIVKYAQQLAIPLRTAYLLIYLANADLQSLRLDDCQVKLNGLSDILCLGTKLNGPTMQSEIMAENTIAKPDSEDLRDLISDFAEVMLDCGPSPCKYQRSPGSPLLFTEPFKLPSFINHANSCDCFYCMSIEYNNLVLMYVDLEAQLNVHRGNIAGAKSCYDGALKLYRHIINFRSFKYKANVLKVLSCFPFPELKDSLDITYCTLLLNYGHYLLLRDNIKKAQSVHRNLLNLISEKKYENMHLYNKALTQYMIMILNINSKENTNQKYSKNNTEFLTVEGNVQLPKTPENNKSRVIFPTCLSPKPDSPPKRRIRKVKCDFSEQKEKSNVKVPFVIHTSPVKGDKKNKKLESNENIKCATPLVSNCAPYMPSLIKTSKKSKLVFQQIPVPSASQNEAPVQENVCNLSEQEGFVIPQSPNAYTPNSLKVSTVLQTRTKMLTRKLKKSTVKKTVTTNANDEETGNDNKVAAIKNVRKNLMSELSVSDTCKSVGLETERQNAQTTVKEKACKGGGLKTERQNVQTTVKEKAGRSCRTTKSRVKNK